MSARRRFKRNRGRRRLADGMCPHCGERPVMHLVPLPGGSVGGACVECWPLLRESLEDLGAVVSDCVEPCCNPGH